MYRRILYGLGVALALAVPIGLAFKYAPRTFTTGQSTDDRTPADKNRRQLEMLAAHRELFEDVAKGDPTRAEELRGKLDIWFGSDGPRYQFSWHDGGGALFGCTLVLYYCPNGEADLPPNFFRTPAYRWHHPMQIDDHWFTAAMDCG